MERRDFLKLVGLGFVALAIGGTARSILKKLDSSTGHVPTDTDEDKGRNMKTIFDTTVLGALTLKNRVWRSATWMAQSEDGRINDRLIETYRTLARGGAGAIITGLTSVSPYDAYLEGGVKFFDDSDLEGHRRLTNAVHAEGTPIFMQTAMVDSVIKGFGKDESRRVDIDRLTLDNIHRIIEYFGDAAARAEKVGYDGVQIHAAHFFFLSQFISPALNHRMDLYGGNAENRARILVDVLRNMRSKTSEKFCIIIKINADDNMPAGVKLDDFLTTCHILDAEGVDAIEVSANGTSVTGVRPLKNEAYFLDYAKALKNVVKTPVILVGGHRSIANMDYILNSTDIEYLSMSRPLIREPNLINRWKAGDTRPALCVSCNNCYATPGHECIFNPHD